MLRNPRFDVVRIALLFLAISSPLGALDWPIASPRPVMFFGSPISATFLSGMELSSSKGLVLAIDEGDLVFVYDEDSSSASRIPSTLGSYVVVEHPRGMAALYANLAPSSSSSYLEKVKKGNILGSLGGSGWFRGANLYFAIFDREAGRWVNPLILLPPLEDKNAPLIRSAALVRKGKSYTLGDAKALPQGDYTIAVDIVDAVSSSGASAPYYIRLVVDGAKVVELQFDVVGKRDAGLSLSSSSPKPYAERYLADGKTILAEKFFSRGRSVIQILVRDYAGNERQASWTLNVE